MATLWRRYGKGSAHPYEGLPLVLVSGVGRSGTTALWQALSRHPALHGTGNENNIIFDVLETARHNCTYPSRRATMHVAPPAYDRQFRLLLLNLLWPQPRRGAARPRMLLATSDLTPPRAEYLLRLFAATYIVCIVRNGIAVVASRATHPHFRDATFGDQCRAWLRSHEMAVWGQGRSGFVLVRQEQLIEAASAREALDAAVVAVGLQPDPAVADTVARRQFHPTQMAAEAPEAAGDLRLRQERWRHWSEAQRTEFLTICGTAMDYFGYPIPWRDRNAIREERP
jgi:hypothetical protein